MRTAFFMFFACLSVSCGQKGGDEVNGVVVFDYGRNYPASELTLSDIADVEYIPIGKSDDFLMSGRINAKGGETYVGDDFVVKADNQAHLFVFDRQGNPIRKIGTQGRGPNEYLYLQYFAGVDEASGEAYVYGGDQRMLVYGLDGEFRRAIDIEAPRFLNGVQLLNDEEIVCFDQMGEGGFYTVSRTDGKLMRKLPVTFTLPYAHDTDGRMAYGNIFRNETGTLLFELRTDTIHRVSPQGELAPAIVDVTKYQSPANDLYGPDNAQLMPLFETSEYIIGSVLCSPWITPDVKEKYYIYDKAQKRWSTLAGEGSSFDGFAAINGLVNIPRSAKTLNAGYAALFFNPITLIENRDKWQSEELSKVLEGVAEDDNPIMMLIRFK